MNRELPELVNYLELVSLLIGHDDRLSPDNPSICYEINTEGSAMVYLLPEDS